MSHLLLIAFFVFLQTSASAEVLCQSIFTNKVQKQQVSVSDILNDRYNLLVNSTLIEKILVKRLSNSISAKVAIDPLGTRKILADHSLLLSILGQGNPREQNWLNRELLAQDLDLIAVSLQQQFPPTKLKLFIHKMTRHPIAGFIWNVTRLPGMKDRSIPSELIEKILRDGPEAHKYELEAAFITAGQSRVEAYRFVATAYRITAIVLLSWLFVEELKGIQGKINDMQVEKLKENLDNLENFLKILQEEVEKKALQ